MRRRRSARSAQWALVVATGGASDASSRVARQARRECGGHDQYLRVPQSKRDDAVKILFQP